MAAVDNDVSSYIESVDQLVNDESKIVTYEYLSQTCGIHVNLAKRVLEEYSEVLRKRGNLASYQFIHSVGGFEGKNLKFVLVPDEKLDQAKSQLDRLLSSHFYSVQKGKLGSLELLYNSNRTDIKPSAEQCSAYSGIKCSFVKLNLERSGTSHMTTVTPVVSKPVDVKKSAENKPLAAPVLSNQGDSKASHETNDKPKIEKKPLGKAGLVAMFAKQAQAPPKKKPEPEEEKKPIANKRVARESSDEEIENKEEQHEKATNKRFKLAEEPKKNLKVEPKNAKKTVKRSGSLDKKRRRIQQLSDSEDSENEEVGNDDEDMVVSSPERPQILKSDDDDEDMVTATPKQPSQKKRTRKLVTTHVVGEDGFLVTKKEYVVCDEDEEVPSEPKSEAVKEVKKESPVKVEPEPAVAKKTSPVQKTKQRSIMNFFTKK